MKRKIVCILTVAAASAMLLGGCGSSGSVSYNDGTYEGTSDVYENDDGSEDGNGYGVVSLTIEDGAITDCTFTTYEPDGTLKDEEYGMQDGEVANRDYYNKAQKAVAACDEYATLLIESGSLDGIDAISGATINYESFVDAVTKALAEAEAE